MQKCLNAGLPSTQMDSPNASSYFSAEWGSD
jgi:hypothetical protein